MVGVKEASYTKPFKVFLISSQSVWLDHTSAFRLFVHSEDVVHDAPSTHGGCCWVFCSLPSCADSLVEDVMHPDRAEQCLLKCEPLPPVCITGQFDQKKIQAAKASSGHESRALIGWCDHVSGSHHNSEP